MSQIGWTTHLTALLRADVVSMSLKFAMQLLVRDHCNWDYNPTFSIPHIENHLFSAVLLGDIIQWAHFTSSPLYINSFHSSFPHLQNNFTRNFFSPKPYNLLFISKPCRPGKLHNSIIYSLQTHLLIHVTTTWFRIKTTSPHFNLTNSTVSKTLLNYFQISVLNHHA